MVLTRILDLITWIFGTLAFGYAILTSLSVGGKLDSLPALRHFSESTGTLLFVAVFFSAVSGGAVFLKTFLLPKPNFNSVKGPQQEFLYQATDSAVHKELKEKEGQNVEKAFAYFKAATYDYTSGRYADAFKVSVQATHLGPRFEMR